MIKFNKYHVTDGKVKARVWYSLDNRTDGRKCVTIYARDYTRELQDILPANYKNETRSEIDFFEKGRAVLFEDHPLYAIARQRAESRA